MPHVPPKNAQTITVKFVSFSEEDTKHILTVLHKFRIETNPATVLPFVDISITESNNQEKNRYFDIYGWA